MSRELSPLLFVSDETGSDVRNSVPLSARLAAAMELPFAIHVRGTTAAETYSALGRTWLGHVEPLDCAVVMMGLGDADTRPNLRSFVELHFQTILMAAHMVPHTIVASAWEVRRDGHPVDGFDNRQARRWLSKHNSMLEERLIEHRHRLPGKIAMVVEYDLTADDYADVVWLKPQGYERVAERIAAARERVALPA